MELEIIYVILKLQMMNKKIQQLELICKRFDKKIIKIRRGVNRSLKNYDGNQTSLKGFKLKNKANKFGYYIEQYILYTNQLKELR